VLTKLGAAPTIQQSFAFDKRISDLEADKRRTA
jgi:hypothetical protein